MEPESKKRVVFLFFMILLGSLFSLIYLVVFGNTDQIYNDIIVEYTSSFSSNKSAERNLLFLLIFTGIFVYFLFFVDSKRKWGDQELEELDLLNNSKQKSKEFVCALISISATFLLIFNNVYQIVITSLLYAVILFIIDREIVYIGICTFYLGVYAFIGLYRFYVFLGGMTATNNMMIAACVFLVSLLPLVLKNKRKSLIRLGMIESVFVPTSLLIYLSNKYKYGDKIISINTPVAVESVVLLLIVVFVIEAIYILIRKWNCAEKNESIITCGSCVVIMAFNRFDGTGVIMPTDMHHPFENIIGFSQVFKLGQTPFENYVPVSGMYSIMQGAIFDFFGDGTFSNYYVTNNLFYLFIIIAIIILLRKQIDGAYVLLLSLVFYVQSYNRLAFMLPIMLLLSCSKLIEKKNIWLMTWFITSLLQGLYYPLYGAATCLAFVPLGIWQAVTYVKSGALKRDVNTLKFWLGWGLCVIILLFFSKYLLGTFRHMLAMSSQSVLADGISRFGQLVPNWFFDYLGDNHLALRIGLYNIFTIMIPVAFVWTAFALTLKVANISYKGKKIKILNLRTACLMMSAVIMPIICYTYTFTRLDIDSIYARSTSVLFIGMILILVFVWNYLKHYKLRLLIVLTVIAIPAIINTEGVFGTEANSKLVSYYTVPDGYVHVENDKVDKLGTGFIEQGIYDSIEETYLRFEDKNRKLSYIGDPSWFGYFYLSDIKGDGAMELGTVKSFSATKETIDIARKNGSIIAPSFIPFHNYYLYHWLLTSGEYVWNAEAREFIPNDRIYTKDEILEQNKNISIAWNDMDIGKTASSWGSSLKSLEELFTEPKVVYSTRLDGNSLIVNFEKAIDGDYADFIYLEFDNMESEYQYTLFNLNGEVAQEENLLGKYLMKKNYNPNMIVQVRWQDENNEIHTMNCNMSKGKLLIPLGAGLKWLLNQHDYISIGVYQNGNEIILPEVSNIRLLKIREVN